MSNEQIIYFKDLTDDWLKHKRITVKNSTYVKYRNTLQKHVIPLLGQMPINNMDNHALLDFVDSKLNLATPSAADMLSRKTVKDILLIVNNIIKYGKNCYPHTIPNIDIAYPTIPKSEIRILTHIEQKALEEVLYKDMNNVKLGILICLYTGLRLGEICGIRWEDISLEDGTISVKRTVQRLQTFASNGHPKTRLVIDSPKTSNSFRKIPIPDFLLSVIKKYVPTDNTLFLLTERKECMEPRTMENYFYSYISDALVICRNNREYADTPGKLTFHCLRHTFATRCVEAGFEIKCLSEILGHANVNITLNRYVHSSMQMKRANMEKLKSLHEKRA